MKIKSFFIWSALCVGLLLSGNYAICDDLSQIEQCIQKAKVLEGPLSPQDRLKHENKFDECLRSSWVPWKNSGNISDAKELAKHNPKVLEALEKVRKNDEWYNSVCLTTGIVALGVGYLGYKNLSSQNQPPVDPENPYGVNTKLETTGVTHNEVLELALAQQWRRNWDRSNKLTLLSRFPETVAEDGDNNDTTKKSNREFHNRKLNETIKKLEKVDFPFIDMSAYNRRGPVEKNSVLRELMLMGLTDKYNEKHIVALAGILSPEDKPLGFAMSEWVPEAERKFYATNAGEPVAFYDNVPAKQSNSLWLSKDTCYGSASWRDAHSNPTGINWITHSKISGHGSNESN